MRLGYVTAATIVLALVWPLLAAGVPVGIRSGVRAQEAEGQTVWDGVYTVDQAARGMVVYEADCSRCHLADLSGSNEGRPLAGERFRQDWYEDTLGVLHSRMRRLMPFDEPDSLGEQAYLDVLAYILQVNEFPAGDAELVPETLDPIRIEGPDGPGPVPNFAMVRVVGCLMRDSGGAWSLTQATEPVRTHDPAASSAEQLAALESTAPGSHTFELINVYPSPDDHEAHQMEVKGLLIRLPDTNRINVSSATMVSTACES